MPKSEQLRKQARRKLKPPPRNGGSQHDQVASLAFEGVEDMSASKRPLFPIFEASDDAGEDDAVEDVAQHVEKKRRLSVEQVKSLEKYFELENKLEPERKLQLARELGLQPRQVAVWFQNRRARWKTKQLEKDYDALKVNLDTLKSDYTTLLQEKLKLEAEVQRLSQILKPRTIKPESDEEVVLASDVEVKLEDESDMSNKEDELSVTTKSSKTTVQLLSSSPPCKKDCSSSDSDDSEILDEESTPLQQQRNQHQQLQNQQLQNQNQNQNQNQQQNQAQAQAQLEQQEQQQQVMLDMDPLLADDDDSYVRLFQEGYTRAPKLEAPFQYDDVGSGGFIGLDEQDQGWWEWP